MQPLSSTLATVFGGSGFIGTPIVQELARRGYRVRVAVRRPDLALHVKTFGNVGQIVPVQANLRNEASINRALEGSAIVVNLVGIGGEAGAQTFEAVHVEGARTVARLARAHGATALVHMSALGVDRATGSDYARSKLAGEQAVFEAFADAVVMRPSLVFGPGDGFFNMMGSIARMSPIMPVISGRTRFQPVHVGDVAEAFARAASGEALAGTVYELGGPEIVTYRHLLKIILRETGRKRPLVDLPDGIAAMMAGAMSLLPFPALLTRDQLELLKVDNIVSDAAIDEGRTLEGLGIAATSMEAILSSYLWRFMKHGQFDRFGNDQHRASTGTTQ